MCYCPYVGIDEVLSICNKNEEYFVTIMTDPRQGPFRLDQTVDFSCVVEPAPPDSVTYHWRTVESVYGGSTFTQQNFSRTYNYNDLRYCWYFCEVMLNETLVGSANKLVEVSGENSYKYLARVFLLS